MSADYKVILIATISFVAGGIMSRLTTGMQAGKLLTPDAVLTNRSFYNAPIQNIAKSRGANISTFEHVQDNQQFPTSPSFIEEIVPPELYKYQYAPDKLRFNVSKSMLRRSRPIIGNNERLHAYIEKLHAKLCTTVLFLGGSVTDGHNVRGGAEQAYPRYFQFWLNGRYPCKNEDGSPGQHTIKKTHAQNSQTHFIHWSMVSEIDKIDLVFIEFNINDAFIPNLAHNLEDKGENGKLKQYADLWYSEVLLRRLLLLQKPHPLAIVTFNSDYIGPPWATFPPYTDPLAARQSLFRQNEEPMKLFINAMYEIPVFSASIWMLPLASKNGTAWQFDRANNPYSTSWWHTDKCCHPSAEGHRILSLVLIYCMVEEEKILLESGNDPIMSIEHDMTLKGNLRDPIYLSPDEDSIYVHNARGNDTIDIDFTDPRGEKVWGNFLVTNEGWKWYADNGDNDKFGLITNTTGAHVAIDVSAWKNQGLVEVSFVMSYENFGISLAWVDPFQENIFQSRCTAALEKGLVNSNLNDYEQLIAFWNERVSVPTVHMLRYNLTKFRGGNSKVFLHICLTPRHKMMKGTENKFKLLGVRLY